MGLVHSAICSLESCNENSFSNLLYLQGEGMSSSEKIVSVFHPNNAGRLEEDSVVMIIQMQGGTINNSNTTNYGAGNGTPRGATLNDAGYYEFNIVESFTQRSPSAPIFDIKLKLDIENNYKASDNNAFQVIKVPICDSVIINQNITVAPWNGTLGGVISMLSLGPIDLNANISASKAGFRGAYDYIPGIDTGAYIIEDYTSKVNSHAQQRNGWKGEGFIGFPTFNSVPTNYPNGFDCAAGAPGNAGGGGNFVDAGGGGGGNGGVGGNGGSSTFRQTEPNKNFGGYGGDRVRDFTADVEFQKLFLGLKNSYPF